MRSEPRWHAHRTNLLPVPDKPILSRKQGELLTPQEWLRDEWESDWNPKDVMASLPPNVKFKMANYSQSLPLNAVYGNVRDKITSNFGIHHDTKFTVSPKAMNACLHYDDNRLKQEWARSLNLSTLDDGVRWVILDTGASQSCSPNKDDFIDLESGNFGSIETASADAHVPIKGRGIIRWMIIDENGKTGTLEFFALYIPEMKFPCSLRNIIVSNTICRRTELTLAGTEHLSS